jgi:hypothetical protein
MGQTGDMIEFSHSLLTNKIRQGSTNRIPPYFPRRNRDHQRTGQGQLISKFLDDEGCFRVFRRLDGDGGGSDDISVYYFVCYAVLSKGRIGYRVLLLRVDSEGYSAVHPGSMYEHAAG